MIDSISALRIMKQYLGRAEEDKTWDETYEHLLEASKTPSNYRPWITAAFQLWTASAGVDRGLIKSADGVTWLSPEEIATSIKGLLGTQEAMDGSNLTDIPDGWQTETMRTRLCGCDQEEKSLNVSFGGFVV